jgi:uncharacterized protein (TIGR02466 family)
MMVENWFAVPIYYNDLDKDICKRSKDEVITAFNNLNNSNLLTNFNGTSSLSYNTLITDVIRHFNMKETRNLLVQECCSYITALGIKCKEVNFENNWVIGYEDKQYQGEHNHGYENNSISGVFYVEVPHGSSPIIFTQPNPYNNHVTITESHGHYSEEISYNALENRIIIFPSYIRHRVPSSSKLEGRRIAFVFNASIKI